MSQGRRIHASNSGRISNTMTDDAYHPLRILLAEEDSLDRAALVRALGNHNHGIYITEVSSLDAACDALGSRRFDAVLIRHQWRNGDAGRLLPIAHGIQQGRPAVIVIGNDSDDTLAGHYIQVGAQAYLAKSEIRPCSLLSTIVQAQQHARQMEELENQAAYLKVQAEHDALTGLYNRRFFDQILHSCFAQAGRYGYSFALLMIDLDQFKQVNDTWGHCAGDTLLQQVAAKLCGLIRDSDTACRIGGDEFAILLPEILNHRQPAILAERLAEALLEPIQTEGGDVLVTASIGIAIYPDHGTTAEELLRNADRAMYRSKHRDASITTCTNPANIPHQLFTPPR